MFRRILKNREKIIKTPPPPLNHPIKVAHDEKKQRIEQAKLAIGKKINPDLKKYDTSTKIMKNNEFNCFKF